MKIVNTLLCSKESKMTVNVKGQKIKSNPQILSKDRRLSSKKNLLHKNTKGMRNNTMAFLQDFKSDYVFEDWVRQQNEKTLEWKDFPTGANYQILEVIEE